MNPQITILFCQCRGGQQIEESAYTPIASFLLGLKADDPGGNSPGINVAVIDDLCHWSIREKQRMQTLALTTNVVLVAACSCRAMENLLRYAGLDTGTVHINRFINYRLESADSVIDQLKSIIEAYGPVVSVQDLSLDYKPANLAWFPVIDSEHCTQCRKCENFCLFGVYKNIDGKVSVEKPTKCKPYCPACARICPHNAVLFPKHDQPEINGGSFNENVSSDNNMPTSLKGPDLMNMLRNRNAAAEKAAELGIPKQVLDGLTPEEINKILGRPSRNQK